MTDDHCGDDAELYALGELSSERCAQIEQHAVHCEPCRERVLAAETAATSLASMLPRIPSLRDTAQRGHAARAGTSGSRGPFRFAAVAAAVFTFATCVEGVALQRASVRATDTDRALSVLASSHFNHTTLTSPAGTAVKVLYARDGSWVYVIANGLEARVGVDVGVNGTRRMLGELAPGAPATLFVANAGKVTDVLLVEGNHVVARGTPSY